MMKRGNPVSEGEADAAERCWLLMLDQGRLRGVTRTQHDELVRCKFGAVGSWPGSGLRRLARQVFPLFAEIVKKQKRTSCYIVQSLKEGSSPNN